MKILKLGDICEISTGSTDTKDASENGQYPLFDRSKKVKASDKYLFDCEALIMPGEGAEFLPRHYIGKFDLHQRAYAMYNFSELINPQYLYYYLISVKNYFADNAVGATVKSLRRRHFTDLEVPLPSLEKQSEIVTKLDSAFAEIEIMRLNIFGQLDANVSLLSRSIRNLINDPDVKCRNTTLDNICENLDNKRIPITRDVRASGKYPYYGASGIIDYVENYIFEGDALLVSEDGANLLARSTPIAFSVSGKYWVNNHAHILKFVNKELQKYVEYLLENTKLDDFITGAAQPKLTQRALNTIPIRIPVDEEDIKKIVTIASSLKELSSSMSENLKLRLNLTDELQASLLGKYFNTEEAVA
jgi:type I restriction enzyme, S subunit